ncbi:MAG: DUF167 domain-containing protein [Caulobacterales bacterium]|nr:DUF167 domain-containing protein [Caulobacterales bacterium]
MATLHIRLTPGAAHDRIDGWDVDADGRPVLKCRVRAKPMDGQANTALIALVAEALDLSRADVTLVRGGQSRLKRLSIAGIDESEIRRRLNTT